MNVKLKGFSIGEKNAAKVFIGSRPLKLKGFSIGGADLTHKFITTIDTNGNPISGVTVTVTDSLSALILTTTTNANGEAFWLFDSTTENQPVTITLSKSGLLDKSIKQFNIVDETDLLHVMESAPANFLTVIGIDGVGISGVTVEVIDANTATNFSGTTNGSGQVAHFTDPALVNPVKITMVKLGYISETLTGVTFDATTNLRHVMNTAPPNFLTVVDITGVGISGVTVEVIDANTVTNFSGTTNANGQVAHFVDPALVNPVKITMVKSGYFSETLNGVTFDPTLDLRHVMQKDTGTGDIELSQDADAGVRLSAEPDAQIIISD